MRIGVFGGTFDPPHRAHLAVADAAIAALDLDLLHLVPCRLPPLKGPAVAGAEHRLAMCQLLVAGRPAIRVEPLELRRDGPSYTADTLAELTAAEPGASWWLVLGSDALADFPRWHRPERILELARLAVVDRPDTPLGPLLAGLPEAVRSQVDRVPMPPLPLASTVVRIALRACGTAEVELTPEVAAYVAKHRLYQDA